MRSDGSQSRRVLLGGGIGAGKSSVASVFVDAGFRLIEADGVGVEVLQPGTEATRAVARTWPMVVEDGIVDRAALAAIVFTSRAELAKLEAITHPEIRNRIVRAVEMSNHDVVVEVPVQHLHLPGPWLRIAVVADTDVRISRAVMRGGTPEDVRNRIASQASDEEWAAWADMTIDNSGAWEDAERATLAWIESTV